MDLALFVMFNKSMNFIRRYNRENFYLSSQRFQIWWISKYLVYVSHNIIQNFSSVSPILCLLGQKYTGAWGRILLYKTASLETMAVASIGDSLIITLHQSWLQEL